jgi:hypothetical protein
MSLTIREMQMKSKRPNFTPVGMSIIKTRPGMMAHDCNPNTLDGKFKASLD